MESLMDNIVTRVEGKKLIVEIDLSKPGVQSSTGKTKLIASTRGAAPIDCNGVRPGVKLALNVMVPL
jgi:hypothetical protein